MFSSAQPTRGDYVPLASFVSYPSASESQSGTTRRHYRPVLVDRLPDGSIANVSVVIVAGLAGLALGLPIGYIVTCGLFLSPGPSPTSASSAAAAAAIPLFS
ncbi:hypothetical protein OC842_002340 [Tilletia horrida]|uniref:Uncharacterized protein n=1 Tax=Tilletia horrida TaxID=155126 RepID=A0AAN6GFJ8_9BASI|nr:hypothetical protein OC842_002340 [Tilletia horrida]